MPAEPGLKILRNPKIMRFCGICPKSLQFAGHLLDAVCYSKPGNWERHRFDPEKEKIFKKTGQTSESLVSIDEEQKARKQKGKLFGASDGPMKFVNTEEFRQRRIVLMSVFDHRPLP